MSTLLLTMEDLNGHPLNPNCSAFEALLEVARVASLKLTQQRKSRGSFKRSYDTAFDDREKKKMKRRQQQKRQQPQCRPWPNLPEHMRRRIEEMGGSEVSLLIQKTVYPTDLSAQHNRLSLPLKQIKNPHFLRKWESQLLNDTKNGSFNVVLIEPSLRATGIVFGRWDMTKSSSYILRSSWTKVARENGLMANDVVQVWSFRVQHQLCMALVKIPSSYS